eukprot:1145934-Pelagomonas_calceolata.AAC.1
MGCQDTVMAASLSQPDIELDFLRGKWLKFFISPTTEQFHSNPLQWPQDRGARQGEMENRHHRGAGRTVTVSEGYKGFARGWPTTQDFASGRLADSEIFSTSIEG